MELYHGTMEKFEKFDPNFTCDMGFHFGTFSSAAARVGNIKNIPGSQKAEKGGDSVLVFESNNVAIIGEA